jgi:hypothetical protein
MVIDETQPASKLTLEDIENRIVYLDSAGRVIACSRHFFISHVRGHSDCRVWWEAKTIMQNSVSIARFLFALKTHHMVNPNNIAWFWRVNQLELYFPEEHIERIKKGLGIDNF